MRGIQYAAVSRFRHRHLGILDRPPSRAMTDGRHSFAFSRLNSPEVCPNVSRQKNQRARGMPDARCTRGLACKIVQKKRTRAYRFSGGDPTFPAQWFYGLLRALPGVSGFPASVAFGYGTSAPGRADMPPKDLTPTAEASGPHDFTVRNSTVRQRAV